MGCAAGVKRKRPLWYLEDRPSSFHSGECCQDRDSLVSNNRQDRDLTTQPHGSSREQKKFVPPPERQRVHTPSVSQAPSASTKGFDKSVKLQRQASNKAETILKKQRAKSDGLWSSLNAEVNIAIQRWKSTGRWNPGEKKTRVLVDLSSAVSAKNAALFATAMHNAGKLGCLQDPRLRELLDNLLMQEELEGTWQCLVSALKDADRFVLRFWLDEADGKGIDIPPEVTDALLSLEGEVQRCAGHGHATRWVAQAEFDARVAEAQSKGDHHMLQRLVFAADRFGVDPEFARATLEALRPEKQSHEQTEQTSSPEQWTLDPELADVIGMTNEKLLQELRKYGVELSGAELDHYDLVQLVCAARTMSRMPASGYQSSGFRNAPSFQNTSSRGRCHQEKFPSANDGFTSDSQGPSASPQGSSNGLKRSAALVCLEFSDTCSPTEEELRSAYKLAALKWHPDRQHNHGCQEEAKRKFQEIHDAYELLSSS